MMKGMEVLVSQDDGFKRVGFEISVRPRMKRESLL